jgi:hypothetical protein
MAARSRTSKNKFLIGLSFIALVAAITAGGWTVWRYHGPMPETPIYTGLVYGCEPLPDTPESGGLVHWVRADLNAPGVSIYVTPKDADATSQGCEYKLSHTSAQVADAHLAAAVNGTLFDSKSWYIRLPGDLATSNETVIADHVVNHIHAHSYLMWWDANKVAHLETTKPPGTAALASAVWGISGQTTTLVDGKVSQFAGTAADKRTMIAADPAGRLVWIACFDKASGRFAAEFLRRKGATIGVLVDGGTSTAMALGSEAAGVRSGTVTGNWRPVATVFGFKADPLPGR